MINGVGLLKQPAWKKPARKCSLLGSVLNITFLVYGFMIRVRMGFSVSLIDFSRWNISDRAFSRMALFLGGGGNIFFGKQHLPTSPVKRDDLSVLSELKHN